MAKRKKGKGGQKDTVRFRKGEQFIGVNKSLWDSQAFKTLKPSAKILFLQFIFLAFPDRNGRIGMSHSKAAEIAQVNKATAGKHIEELMIRGFLQLRSYEMWQERKSREYRVTACYCYGLAPTEEFLKWRPGMNFFGRTKKFSGVN